MKTLTQKIGNIGTARRKRVNARTAALIAEEMTLQKIRQARKLTQVMGRGRLGITQNEADPKPLRRKHAKARD